MSESDRPDRRRFTLSEARAMLPAVRRMTEEAIEAVERLEPGLEGDEASRAAAEAGIQQVLRAWGQAVEAVGAEPKGLWLTASASCGDPKCRS